MKIIAIDVSGNFNEGKGTSGLCLMEEGKVLALGEISAKDYKTFQEYWSAHETFVLHNWPDHLIIEGYKLYNHKGKEAKIQANSELETPQLIGFLKMVAFRWNIPVTIQFASEVKTRWSEDVLVRLGILTEKNKRYYWNGTMTSTHKRDSLKHALHFERYGRKKLDESK